MSTRKYIKEDGTLGVQHQVKYGRSWWKLVSSRVMPFYTHGEEKDQRMSDLWIRVSFTSEGWLEQVWELEVEKWYEWKTQEEYNKIMGL